MRKTRIIIVGCFGRMGTAVREIVTDDPYAEIVAGIDVAATGNGVAFPVYANIEHCTMPADVVLDFLPPTEIEDTLRLLDFCVIRKLPLVLCTTALPIHVMEAARAASKHVGIFISANLSLGVNLLVNMLSRAAKLLDESQFDIEIIEKHHNQKLDAPSGTAVLLFNTINQALGGEMQMVTDRSPVHEKRGKSQIGIHALRGGSIVGEHTILFAGRDEQIEFKHTAQSRNVFATGAVKAARYMQDRPAGLYDMQNLINDL